MKEFLVALVDNLAEIILAISALITAYTGYLKTKKDDPPHK